eukprot:CAMPEP_0175078148 /NCGR_PEP_ID=MMETSP0052_2-20121109/23909_1 /TAXON_ID=51329 ORGANISM="Polytomella parva, Strain SAG 63-3" /NCGR_SAMPLE_ID=MMETSP0052_2 /ASSEMBLY_ACC=CAM_ASM_000194 /LENGTH=484 /DNA_ID=CAMNT_0016347941 /DNA_START=35 /DNA_END=1486 /DNA_ORIENTATION=-
MESPAVSPLPIEALQNIQSSIESHLRVKGLLSENEYLDVLDLSFEKCSGIFSILQRWLHKDEIALADKSNLYELYRRSESDVKIERRKFDNMQNDMNRLLIREKELYAEVCKYESLYKKEKDAAAKSVASYDRKIKELMRELTVKERTFKKLDADARMQIRDTCRSQSMNLGGGDSNGRGSGGSLYGNSGSYGGGNASNKLSRELHLQTGYPHDTHKDELINDLEKQRRHLQDQLTDALRQCEDTQQQLTLALRNGVVNDGRRESLFSVFKNSNKSSNNDSIINSNNSNNNDNDSNSLSSSPLSLSTSSIHDGSIPHRPHSHSASANLIDTLRARLQKAEDLIRHLREDNHQLASQCQRLDSSLVAANTQNLDLRIQLDRAVATAEERLQKLHSTDAVSREMLEDAHQALTSTLHRAQQELQDTQVRLKRERDSRVELQMQLEKESRRVLLLSGYLKHVGKPDAERRVDEQLAELYDKLLLRRG